MPAITHRHAIEVAITLRRRSRLLWLACAVLSILSFRVLPAESPVVQVIVSLTNTLGPLEIDRFALGQGGLSEEPMWDNRIAEIRALQPKVIRLFVQEYFDL